uniref:Uncharacterized protein n=1 Tax=Anguilla anguilla TaxID=7936 RepID=A0A0E9WAZ6_ANGAN
MNRNDLKGYILSHRLTMNTMEILIMFTEITYIRQGPLLLQQHDCAFIPSVQSLT